MDVLEVEEESPKLLDPLPVHLLEHDAEADVVRARDAGVVDLPEDLQLQCQVRTHPPSVWSPGPYPPVAPRRVGGGGLGVHGEWEPPLQEVLVQLLLLPRTRRLRPRPLSAPTVVSGQFGRGPSPHGSRVEVGVRGVLVGLGGHYPPLHGSQWPVHYYLQTGRDVPVRGGARDATTATEGSTVVGREEVRSAAEE